MLNTLILLFLFQFCGELVQRATQLPIPGPVLGMLALLAYLLLRGTPSDTFTANVNQILGHLPLFFVPAGAGLMLYPEVLSQHGIAILVSLVFGTILAFAFTAKLIQQLLHRKRKDADG